MEMLWDQEVQLYIFLSLKDQNELPITDERSDTFYDFINQGVELVWHAFEDMMGGEIYVKKIPSKKLQNVMLLLL